MQSAAQFSDSQSIALAVGSYIFHDISRVSVLDVLGDARKIESRCLLGKKIALGVTQSLFLFQTVDSETAQ